MMNQRTVLDRYRTDLRGVAPLQPAEELELARAYREGDQKAGAKLIKSSLPFVIRIAREYRRWGIPLEDLIQQGNMGLLKAAAKFEPERECRLITYAVYWIRAEIREYVVRGYRIVRLGTTRTERRAMRTFRRKGVETPEQLAEESGMPLPRAKKLWPLLCRGDVSLDATYDDSPSALERLGSGAGTPEDEVIRDNEIAGVRTALVDALENLTDRERRIVEMRLLTDEPVTLAELGLEMGVSKERVRQLEVRARGKLRVSLAEFAPAA